MSIVHIAFYPSDWLAGTRGLSDAEAGVYINLICRMYEMAGPIERDDNRLARVCGCKSKASFVKSLNYLISEGKIMQSGQELFNERVQKEIKNTTEKSSKAKSAAQSRWDKKSNKNNDSTDANASSKHMPDECQSEPESEIDKSIKKNIQKKASPKSLISKAWEPDQGCIDKAYSVGMDRTIIEVEAENFRNHHFNKQSKMVSWSLAWGTWCNNWKKFQASKSQSFKAKNKPSEFDILDELADRIEAQGAIQ